MQHSIFYWYGIDKNGNKVLGETEGSNILAIKINLYQQGIRLLRIRKQKRLLFQKVITHTEITYFTRQIATLLKAGMPLIKAFTTVSKGTKNLHLRNLIHTIQNDVEAGNTFQQALLKHQRYFNDFYCQLINVAENTGQLDLILEKLADYKEKMALIKNKLYQSFYYPIIVLLISVIIAIGLIFFVVPQFSELFKNFGATLPLFTRMIIHFSQFMQSYGFMILISVMIAIITGIYQFKRQPAMQRKWDAWILKIPLIGTLLQKGIIVQFSQTLAITFSAGISLIDGLKSAAKITGNDVYYRRIEKIADDIAEGKPLHGAMQSTALFPEMVVQMILVGEESGTLEQMLLKIADHYQKEVQHTMDQLNTLLEPALMVILSLLVGGLIIAMYLPIFKLGTIAF